MSSRKREKTPPALRSADSRSVYAVMACSDMHEADQVGRCLEELNTGCLVTYYKAEDLLLHAPGGEVALVILATQDSLAVLRGALRWLRRHWPRCPVTVIGDAGCGEHELAAREGGATFLTRPVSDEQWLAVLRHAFQRIRQLRRQAGPGHYAAEGHLTTG